MPSQISVVLGFFLLNCRIPCHVISQVLVQLLKGELAFAGISNLSTPSANYSVIFKKVVAVVYSVNGSLI